MAKIIGDMSPSAKRELELEITQEELQKVRNRVLRKVQQQVHLKGFRPGKAPIPLIEKLYGASIDQEALEQAVGEKLRQEAEARKLQVVGTVRVEEVKETDTGYRVRITFEVIPNFEIPPASTLEVKKVIRRITSADVETEIQRLRSRLAELVKKPEDATVEAGDYVFVDYEERDEQGKVVQKAKNSYLPMVPGETDERIINAFLGKKVGDTVEVDITLVDAEGNETPRHLVYRIREIRKVELPPVDDEFAVNLGFESLEDLEKQIRQDLEKAAQEESERQLEDEIVQQLYERIKFELPESLVKEYMELYRKQIRDEVLQQVDDPEALLRSLAERTLRREILLDRVAEEFNLEPTDEEIHAEVEKRAREYRVNPKTYRKRLEKSGGIEHIKSVIRRRKALDLLKSQVKLEVIVE